MYLTFALLTFAILAVWLRPAAGERAAPWRTWAWLALWLAAIGSALPHGIMEARGVVWLAALAFTAGVFMHVKAESRMREPRARHAVKIAAAIAGLVLVAGLMTHQLPGFNNPRVISTTFGPDALPYRLHLNFDKTSAGLLLLALGGAAWISTREWRTLLRRTAPIAALTIVVVMALSLAAGYVRFAPKFPREAWLWGWANLVFTCVAEEALFRGFVQARLARAWSGWRHGAWLALLVGAVLFGFAHAGGGPMYVALATIAGAGYGWAFQRTQRLEASILTHFALNALHFLGFTYPALAR